jgi:hypothetical protein
VQQRFEEYATQSIPLFDFADTAMPSTIRRMHVFLASVTTNEDTLLNRYEKALVTLKGSARR